MAEFKDVINQWMRRCEACDRNEKVKCVINGHVCNGFCKMRKYINPEFVEQDVMSWAAEHPEPVYPTWWSWLINEGVIASGSTYNAAISHLKMHSIPAETAQKLGIEPKEG